MRADAGRASGRGDDPGGDTTLVARVQRSLRREIIRLKLRPGARLRIDDLRAHYDVSSSAVREALLFLVADGLVTTEPNRGFRVAPMSLADYAEVTRLRKELERVALTESLGAGGEEWEVGIVAALYRLNAVNLLDQPGEEAVDLYNDRNEAFHNALAGASPSWWIRRFRHMLAAASTRYRMLHRREPGAGRDLRTEHQAMADAALARDVRLLCRLSDDHIDRSYRALADRHQAFLAFMGGRADRAGGGRQ